MEIAIILLGVVIFIYTVHFNSKIIELTKKVNNLENISASKNLRIDRLYNQILDLENKVNK